MRAVKHVVLHYTDSPFPNTAIKWIDGRGKMQTRELADPIYNLSQLVDLAMDEDITHFWIHPAYGPLPCVKSYDDYTFAYHERNRQTAAVSCWKRGHGGKKVTIIFPEKTAWDWIQDATPYEMLVVIHYLEQALGVVIGMSPGRVGWNYLKTIHPDWVEEVPDVNLKECHFTKDVARDIIWQRALTLIEQGKAFLHKFDKSAAYPYAATQTDQGVGTPVHWIGGAADVASEHAKGHPQPVGVWRCTINYNGASYDPMMPPVWKEEKGTHAASEGWLPGPIIRLLRSQGHEVIVHECWLFPSHHDVLAKWGNTLWTVREDFRTPGQYINEKCAALAAKATKQIMNHTVGMTGSGKLADDDEMKRPDIRVQTISRHRELTWHNINKVKRVHGLTPVLVYMDALYYISDNPNGAEVVPELMKRTGKFGGYRYEGRIALTPEVLAILVKTNNPGATLEKLNKIGWTL